MKAIYDKEAHALYIKLIDTKEILTCTELVADTVFIDKTPAQQIAGIEILHIDGVVIK